VHVSNLANTPNTGAHTKMSIAAVHAVVRASRIKVAGEAFDFLVVFAIVNSTISHMIRGSLMCKGIDESGRRVLNTTLKADTAHTNVNESIQSLCV